MLVRQATVSDLGGLTPLFDSYRSFYQQPSDEGLARSFLLERFQRSESVIFIVFLNDRMVGFTQLYPSFSSGRAARTFILNDLYVTEEARGKGAGSALLTAAADYARAAGAVRLTLSTAVDNFSAQALYEQRGWTRETAFVAYNLTLA